MEEVVYHLVPTSNHNLLLAICGSCNVVYHLVPTSNHNSCFSHEQDTLVVYHLVPTSNHNFGVGVVTNKTLFIILFLHQTTTLLPPWLLWIRCLSSCSYIKPQLSLMDLAIKPVVYHLVPTSNHNKEHGVIIGIFVVYHLVPTSNHNCGVFTLGAGQLFIILFLHQTTTEVGL